jgi:hypothetical protein
MYCFILLGTFLDTAFDFIKSLRLGTAKGRNK